MKKMLLLRLWWIVGRLWVDLPTAYSNMYLELEFLKERIAELHESFLELAGAFATH